MSIADNVGSDADKVLPMWVIYVNPSDIDPAPFTPDFFVVREQFVSRAGLTFGRMVKGQTLAAMRAWVQAFHPGATRLERDPADDPVIVEVWL